MSWFPVASLRHISSSRSDHHPILLDIEDENKGKAHQQIDRYEMMWEREESLYEEVKMAWDELMTSLKKWGQVKFRVVSKEINKISRRMEELIIQNPSKDHPKLNGLRKCMDELLTAPGRNHVASEISGFMAQRRW
jgi:hypothetical protein